MPMTLEDENVAELMTVAEVARYLRLKERKIYYLLAQEAIPCVRAGKKWLFPKARIDAWLVSKSHKSCPGAAPETVVFPSAAAVLVGSHDPLLEWALHEIHSPIAVKLTGAQAGLGLFAAGGAMLCGIHILEADGRYNIASLQAQTRGGAIVAIEWAKRLQGLIAAKNNPLKLYDLEDVIVRQARLIERQAGAGSQILLERLLAQAGLSVSQLRRLARPARNETELAMAIFNGKADAGIGIAAVAGQLQLAFVPFITERFDLVMTHADYFEPPMQALLEFSHQPEFAEKAKELGGYDVSGLGRVHYSQR
ncbi:MAG: helix-turn-helix transcriptional regulator [Methylovulum sp.]|nr:helix-turn-helix transcriptional regulator [Methylovulum sp.]